VTLAYSGLIIGWAETEAVKQSMIEAGARLVWSKPLPRCETLISQLLEARFRDQVTDAPSAKATPITTSRKQPFSSSRINLVVESVSDRSQGLLQPKTSRQLSRLRSNSFDAAAAMAALALET
jgi:hypothetical protein